MAAIPESLRSVSFSSKQLAIMFQPETCSPGFLSPSVAESVDLQLLCGTGMSFASLFKDIKPLEQGAQFEQDQL